MEGDARLVREAPEKLLYHLAVECAHLAVDVPLPEKARPAGEVDGHHAERLVHGQQRSGRTALCLRTRAAPPCSAFPRVMPVSSIVWWESISMSPVASMVRSKKPWRAKSSSMWLKKGMPVEMLVGALAVELPADLYLGSLSSSSSTSDFLFIASP